MGQLDQIISPKKTLKKNNSYLLIDFSTGKREMYPVLLLTAFKYQGTMYLVVQDMLSKGKRILKLEGSTLQEWLMIDIKYYVRLREISLINSYCCKSSYCRT
jgi:hypothetical protein